LFSTLVNHNPSCKPVEITVVPRLFVSVVLKHGQLFMRVLSFLLCSVPWRPVQMWKQPLYLTIVGL